MADPGDTPTVAQHSLQQLVDMADAIGMVSLDMDGRIRLWNSGAEKLTGYHRNHVEGQPFRQLLAESIAAADFEGEALRKATIAGVRETNCTLARRDGSLCTLSIKTARLSNEGEIYGYGLVMAEAAVTPQMESKQRNNEALLSELQEISSLGLYEVDPGTWTGHCSSTLCGIYGFVNDEPFRDFNAFCEKHVHPDDLSRLIATREQLLKSGGTDEFEYRYRHPDGNDRILLVRRRVIHDGQGRACRLLGTVQDITGRRHAETRLLASETRYRTLLDHATDAFFIHSHGGVIVDANTRAIESLGYTREELIGQKPTKFALQLTSEKLRAISATLDADQVVTYESVHCRKNGSTFPVEVRIRPLWLEGQRFSITMIRDLTKQKQAEQALRDSEERYRRALETMQLGTWYFSGETGRFVLDARCQGHWGISVSDPDLPQMLDMIHPEDRERTRSALLRVRSADGASEPLAVEHRVMQPDGMVRWISLRAVIVQHGDGEHLRIASATGTTLDITAPRSAAVAVKGQNQVLERIATGAPLNEVLDEITHLIEQQIPDSFCSILLLDRDGTRLKVGAASRLPAAYNQAIDGLAIGPAVGSCGTAAWSRQSVLTADIETDARWDDFRHLATEHGLRSCWSVPIFAAAYASPGSEETQLVGTFAVYRRVPGTPNRPAQMALASASYLAGVAVGSARAVQDIRDSEARYAMISQITRSVTFGMSRKSGQNWSIDWARPRFGLLSGYSREEMAADGWTHMFPQEDKARLLNLLDRLGKGESAKDEIRIITKTGETLEVQINASVLPMENEPGTITVIGGLLDISEFKAIEKALRQSEERFHLAMLGANDGLWDWNIKTDEVYYSPQWYAILGYRSSELPGTFGTWVSLLHPDDAVHSQAQMQNFLRSSLDKYEIEFRLRHKDGSYRTIQSRGFVTRENEKPVRLVGTHRDLTERKLAELALRRSEDFLRRAQQMANFGSWTFNLRTRIFSCSEESARIHGLSGLECSQLEWEKLVHPDDAARVLQAFQATLQGRPFDQEYRLVIRGKTKWISVKGSIEADSSGQPTHLIGVTQDVSARRRLEEQLRHSQKMEAFGQLAGGVAHDFNNLLTVINGFSEILLEETDHKDSRWHAIQQIREAGERAAVLTRQLLTLSRRQFTEPRVIGLNEIVSRSESLLRRLIGENITIATILEPGLPNIKADPGQIDQVLLNLVVNARDAMPKGGRVLVATRRRVVESAASDSLSAPSPGHYVELFVSDNGTGMSEETKARIYEPFFSTKGVGKGTGLGLATVYGIIQQNHGFIEVESFPSVGTTFRILWPVCELGQERTDQAASIIETVRGTETILLAEDEPLVRQLAVLSLKACGYDVIEADSGETALRLANSRQGTLPLLITDVVMPGISGTELARRLRQTYPNIRVLYMSGYTDDAVVRCGEFTALDDFLQKPFTPMQLARKVQDVLSISEQAAGVS